MLLFELLNSHDALKFTPNVSATHVKIIPTPEEQLLFDRAGIANEVRSMYVVHAYQEPMSSNITTQDRLKMRGEYHNKPDNVISVINDSLSTVMRTSVKNMAGKWDQSRVAVSQFQNWMSKGNFIVVPMPSSSPTARMIADAIVSWSGAKLVDILEKNSHPPYSREMLKGRTHMPHDYAGKKAEYQNVVDMAQRALEQDDVEAYNRLDDHRKKMEIELNKKTYSRKHHYVDPNSLNGLAYYDTIRAKPGVDISSLHNAYVLFVDDNVARGHSIADAIKHLLIQGIRPKDILGFAPHKFT